ncbi:MAG TPA: hypothetical protein VGM19_04105 [Armatimonadota bacterium]|jgi:hypothetical protein
MRYPRLLVVGLLLSLAAFGGAESPPELTWSVESLAQVVQPLTHPLGGRLPLFLWNFPLPRDDTLVAMRADGRLRRDIETLTARGFLPTVEIGWDGTPAGALAMAQTLQEAGQPVFVIFANLPGGSRALYPSGGLRSLAPDANRAGKLRWWPCLPQADPTAAAAGVRGLLERFRDAGIKVAGVWFDYEGLPYPWAGVYEAQQRSAACRALYPAGVLEDDQRFIEYVYRLRSEALSRAMVDPVRQVFPGALVGNYDEWASSRATPYLANGGESLPPRDLGRFSAAMPRAYASPWYLHQFFPEAAAVTAEQADPIYFRLLLNTISSANANRQAGQLCVPFLARHDPFDPLQSGAARFGPGLSHRRYRELIWHLLLRGTDGFYLYPLGFPNSGVSMEDGFQTLEDTRAVYDQVLAQRRFLDEGRPMTEATAPPPQRGVIWSGLQRRHECLVRAFTLDNQAGEVTLSPWPRVTVTLAAPPEGATYLVRQDGRVVRVGE